MYFFDFGARWRFNQYLEVEENQKIDVSPSPDEECILDLAWKVLFCSKRYLLSG